MTPDMSFLVENTLRILNPLKNVKHFSPTSDRQTSRTMQPYISLMVHFIENWEMKCICLQTGYAPDVHTGEMIALGLSDALKA